MLLLSNLYIIECQVYSNDIQNAIMIYFNTIKRTQNIITR